MPEGIEAALIPAVTTAISAIALLTLRAIFLRILKRWATESRHPVATGLESVLRTPSLLWCGAVALHAGIAVAEVSERFSTRAQTFIELILMISVTVVAANASISLMRNALARIGSPISSSGLVFGVIRASVYTMGALIVLSRMGVAIAPLITALGVGGLAVALALKDTLENLFSGIHLLIDQAITVGDKVKLEGGYEGTVHDIGWRTSKLVVSATETVIIPNIKLAQSIVVKST